MATINYKLIIYLLLRSMVFMLNVYYTVPRFEFILHINILLYMGNIPKAYEVTE